jgi:hypothetical protein
MMEGSGPPASPCGDRFKMSLASAITALGHWASAEGDRCHYSSEVPFRHLAMPVLSRTIYACGLRASEAR